jgi:hypothetical protein
LIYNYSHQQCAVAAVVLVGTVGAAVTVAAYMVQINIAFAVAVDSLYLLDYRNTVALVVVVDTLAPSAQAYYSTDVLHCHRSNTIVLGHMSQQ